MFIDLQANDDYFDRSSAPRDPSAKSSDPGDPMELQLTAITAALLVLANPFANAATNVARGGGVTASSWRSHAMSNATDG
jgi:hypothetical protein